ncbi:MAG: helix-turn-helix domain-containing protein [Chloroflexi bacterium]|nr:helix-turn-helix domain-containing protein [Chloroflexota bacterium]MCC6894187.1 helix-turn-helix domain-containing protein [Anaerolineae bacterium]
MSAVFEGRSSDSPYIHMIWRGHVDKDYQPVCPADPHWNLLFTQRGKHINVKVEGATDQTIQKHNFEGSEFLVIRFKLGMYMPVIPVHHLLNTNTDLPDASSHSFWLNGASWQLPTFENVETFVERLVREDVLAVEPVVNSVMQEEEQNVSFRTVRRRFLQATGLTPKIIQQINRAQQASDLLQQGVSILDTVYQLGYSDQPHMTRSLKRFIGTTPAQLARMSAAE